MTGRNEVAVNHKAAQALYAATSTEETRPVFAYARLRDTEGVATDGKVLYRAPLRSACGYGDPRGERYVHRDTLRLVKPGGTLRVDLDTGAAILRDKKGLEMTLPEQMAEPGEGGRYPAVEQVDPQYSPDAGITVAISGAYLRHLADIARRADTKDARVVFQVVDELDRAVRVYIEDGETPVNGLVMPMRIV